MSEIPQPNPSWVDRYEEQIYTLTNKSLQTIKISSKELLQAKFDLIKYYQNLGYR